MKLRAVLLGLLAGLMLAAASLFILKYYTDIINVWLGKEPAASEVVASALISVQEMNRLTVFSATLVSIPTTKMARRFLPNLERTLIAPGIVEYCVDLDKLSKRNVTWDRKNATLIVRPPDVFVTAPNMNTLRFQSFEKGFAVPFMGDSDKLDRANQVFAVQDLAKQAQNELLMTMARRSARMAISNNFRIPLDAAGIKARVIVRFPREAL